jgi:hypothetical protein
VDINNLGKKGRLGGLVFGGIFSAKQDFIENAQVRLTACDFGR